MLCMRRRYTAQRGEGDASTAPLIPRCYSLRYTFTRNLTRREQDQPPDRRCGPPYSAISAWSCSSSSSSADLAGADTLPVGTEGSPVSIFFVGTAGSMSSMSSSSASIASSSASMSSSSMSAMGPNGLPSASWISRICSDCSLMSSKIWSTFSIFISFMVFLAVSAAFLSVFTVSTVVRWFSSMIFCSLIRKMLFSMLCNCCSYNFRFLRHINAARLLFALV
mmetsp:Transcript_25157/g.44863  ORF Transcript_25157/g.44863 Transcript_25157/m.44863 type:complete len:222 (+) Transcript_25157:85-750(+)